MKVICISGKAGSGKDTFAGYLRSHLECMDKHVLVAHQADLLKYICRTFFEWDGQKDNHGRTLLQYVGTNVVRKQVPDYWVNFLCDMLKFFGKNWDYVLIPDTRFPNEIEVLRDAGFDVLHMRIQRNNYESALTDEQQQHISETALDGYPSDVVIYNNFGLDQLNDGASFTVAKVLVGDVNPFGDEETWEKEAGTSDDVIVE